MVAQEILVLLEIVRFNLELLLDKKYFFSSLYDSL